MNLTAGFIRGLSGLSAAELSDETITELKVIEIAEAAALNYPNLSEYEDLYYKGYKAITLLAPSLLLAIPEKIKDNFNEFSRFDKLQDFIDYAFGMVDAVENPGRAGLDLLEIIVPEIDPVIGEGR
jgi:hypothetical protein